MVLVDGYVPNFTKAGWIDAYDFTNFNYTFNGNSTVDGVPVTEGTIKYFVNEINDYKLLSFIGADHSYWENLVVQIPRTTSIFSTLDFHSLETQGTAIIQLDYIALDGKDLQVGDFITDSRGTLAKVQSIEKISDGLTNVNYSVISNLLDTDGKIPSEKLPQISPEDLPNMSYFDASIGVINRVDPQARGIYVTYHEAEIEFEDTSTVHPDFSINIPIAAGENVTFEVDTTNKVVKINANDTTDYTALENLPSINGVEVTGAKTSTNLKLGLVLDNGGFQAGNNTTATHCGGAIGNGAKATSGGAVGNMAKETSAGGAVGNQAKATSGGAVGLRAYATSGGAVGQDANANNGFAGGYKAEARYATDGTTEISGAVAVGKDAKAQAEYAVQLGTGTNINANTLQFKSYQLVDANGKIPAARLSGVELRDYYTKTETDEIIRGLTPKYCEEITYAELKVLRDSNVLVPGMFYRITDYVCTTTQENTTAVQGTDFDIIVQALSTNTLSETALASAPSGNPVLMSSVVTNKVIKSHVIPHYYEYVDYSDQLNGADPDYRQGKDVFVAYNYLANNEGTTVPVIYKTDAAGLDPTKPDFKSEFEDPDYEDQFYYEGTAEIDGVTYDKWRLINGVDDEFT